jgi:hypothetical protein
MQIKLASCPKIQQDAGTELLELSLGIIIFLMPRTTCAPLKNIILHSNIMCGTSLLQQNFW